MNRLTTRPNNGTIIIDRTIEIYATVQNNTVTKRFGIARRRLIGLTGLLGVFGALCLAGCDPAKQDKPADTSAQQVATGDTRAAAPDAADAPHKVAVISPALTSKFHVSLSEGAAAEAKKLGWPDIMTKAPDKESNYTAQVALVQDVIQLHPDAISICSINPQALQNIVKKANDANIPIFIHNQISTVPGGKVAAYIGYDEHEGGLKCGAAAAEMLKQKNGDYKGEVAILDGEPSDHTNNRAGGFKEALAKYPNIKVDAEQNGKWQRQDGNSVTKDWLQKFPKLDLVFGCSDAMAQGAAQAAYDANHQMLTIGIDGNPDALQDIKDGKYTATLATQPAMIGAKVIDTMADFLNKKTVPQVVKTECVIVTKDNIDQYLK